jgi:hypothetical protein
LETLSLLAASSEESPNFFSGPLAVLSRGEYSQAVKTAWNQDTPNLAAHGIVLLQLLSQFDKLDMVMM